jgi:hypothetical protein
MAKKKKTPSVPTDGATQSEAQQQGVAQQDVQQIVDSLPPEVKQAVVNEDHLNAMEREHETRKAHEAEFAKSVEDGRVDINGDHVDNESVIPTEEQKVTILRVLEAGKEFKPLHEKLTVLFDRIRPDVQTLKDDVFRVRQGDPGLEVLIPTDKGDVLMDWETFVTYAFGVGAERIRQLLQVKDKEFGNKVKTVPKVHLTRAEYDDAINEAFEAGKQTASDADVDEDDESVVPDFVQKLEQTLTQATTVADKSYEYFHQFKDEPETYAMELSAMLIEHGLEFTTIERITKLMLKDAKKTLCDLAVKAVAA